MTVTEPVTGSVPTTARTPKTARSDLGGDGALGGLGGAEAAVGDHGDAVGVARGEVEVVEDREHAEALLGGELAHEVEHLEPVVQVEVADRLVEQQHARLLRERLREREALEVAAGELVGGLVGEARACR